MKRLQAAVIIFAVLALISIPVITQIRLVRTGLEKNGLVGWDRETEQLAEQICAGCNTDEEKVCCIYRWIIDNIEYDYTFDTFYQFFDSSKTIRTKKGVCFDYANLFASMCRSQSIPCFVLDGNHKGDSSIRHTWNRVYFHDVWWNLDLTNDAICKKEGKELYGLKNIGIDPTIDDEDYIITRIY